MDFSKTELIKFGDNRLYIMDIVKYRFKEYLVCIDLTGTIRKNNGRVTITILTQTSGNNFGSVNSDSLFDKLYEKCKKQIKNDSKNVLNIIADAKGSREALQANECAIIAKGLDMFLYE